MSFNSETKEELCVSPFSCPHCRLAEALGMMLYASKLSTAIIRISAENPTVRKRIIQTVKSALGVTPESLQNAVVIQNAEDIKKVYSVFGYENSTQVQLNRALVEDDCCKAAFLRGVLLVGGCVTSPEKSYHLEIVTSHYYVARQTATLLCEMNLNVGYINRRGNHILYFKDSSVIEDVLSTAGATNASMQIMLKKVERDLNNSVNRKVNCDSANLDKTVKASEKQVAAIKKLKAGGVFEALSADLRQTADLRLEYPELSLSALAEKHENGISRPGLSNRLKRLIALSEEL